ncbi:hypothetical protein [Morganella psychrotolerans]|uniref:Fis family transcriptional regulator n=1 Tax=Morganella psychrotolerans TaxID=368603 RepID=A0A1B8HUI7_9GAMM|nr:hypothetical protein [Morganella psychrotolerans]OBU13540.1 hypothetical protein AYY18_02070 [Morganella psychrotolerans]
MKERLKNALSLIECQTVESLISQFLLHSFHCSTLSAMVITLLSPRDNQLISWSVDYTRRQVTSGLLNTDASDIRHPLVQVTFSPVPTFWKNLSQGSYLDNGSFKQFISELPPGNGVHGYPFTDHDDRISGAICRLGTDLENNEHETGITAIYYQIFCRHFRHLTKLNQVQEQHNQLRYLAQLAQEKERRLETMLTQAAAPAHVVAEKSFAGSSDPADVHDLQHALDQYESEILSYRQLTDDNDIARMSENLNLSKRSLIYKLKKYGYMS